jgi:hypothetical protein
MDEAFTDTPLDLNGTFIDLFDPDLPVIREKTIARGEQAFLYDIDKISDKNKPNVICGASRVSDEAFDPGSYEFIAKSPLNTMNVSRIYLPARPVSLVIKKSTGERIDGSINDWDINSGTLLVRFPNDPDGVKVEIRY